MKLLIFTLLTLIGSLGFSEAKGKVFCKNVDTAGQMRIYDATTDDGHVECSEHLMDSAACFVGPRKQVIELINSGEFNWDEEWLERAHFKGTYAVAYKFVDGPNALEFPASIEACTKNFFKNPAVGPFKVISK